MKLLQRSMILLAVIVVLASCSSTDVKNKTEVLDHKGASFGINEPAWLTAYIQGSNQSVEALPEYKNQTCFVVSFIDADRDFAIGMAESASGSSLIAQMIAETVSADAERRRAGVQGEGTSAAWTQASESMSNASYTGFRKSADWWRITRNKSTKVQEAHAFVLYTIESRILSDQIARNLTNIMENNKALSAAEREIYRDLIAHIRSGGFKH